MICNDRLLFIHVGKNGGMSCTRYLLEHLRRPVLSVHAEAETELTQWGLRDIEARTGLNRHCTLAAALAFTRRELKKDLGDFEKIVAVFRHPVTHEYSFYQHLRKPEVIARRQRQQPHLVALAQGDFLSFIKGAGFHRPNLPQEAYVMVDGVIPDNVAIARFETLTTQFPKLVQPFTRNQTPGPLPHSNRTLYTEPPTFSNAELTAIYAKHRYLFDAGYYSLAEY